MVQPHMCTNVLQIAAKQRTCTNHSAGGHLEVRLIASRLGIPDVWPDMRVDIRAHALHAPLVERLLELPMDISEGALTGELRISTYDERTW